MEMLLDSRTIKAGENSFCRHTAFGWDADAPVKHLDLRDQMRVRIDAHKASILQRRLMPAPVEIEPPGTAIDLDRDAMLGAGPSTP
jgi:hypothetical protein